MRFLIEDDKQMHNHGGQQHICEKPRRVKKNDLPGEDRKDTNIYWIAHPPIRPLSDQEYRRVNGCWCAFADEGKRPGTPEVEDYSREERLSMSSPKSLSIEIGKESNEAGEPNETFKRA